MRATPFSNEELDAIARGGTDQFGNSPDKIAVMLAQEIEEHREWLAHFGRVVEAQTLDVKAIGKGRRKVLKELCAQPA